MPQKPPSICISVPGFLNRVIFLVMVLDLILLTALALLPSPARAMTLDQAKTMALEKAPTMAATREQIEQAREAVSQARATYLPTLSAKASYAYTEAVGNAQADETQHTAQLTATQLLFDGFQRKYTLLSAQYGEGMSRAALEDARRLLAWSVAQAWINVELARENIAIAQSNMAFNQKQTQEAIVKQEAGTGSLSDRLNFETKVVTARTTLLDARQSLKEARLGLAALMGYDTAQLPGDLQLAPLEIKESAPIPLATDLEALADQRPDVRQSALAIDQAQAAIGQARSQYYPSLSLTGGYGTRTGDHVVDSSNMGASLALEVSVDLFDGGSRESKVRQARSSLKEKESTLESTRITALSELRTSLTQMETAREKLALQRENTRLIQRTRDLVEQEYQAGQVSLVRLNEAQNDLVSAQGSLAMAQTNLALAMEAFDYYSGNNIP